MLGKQPRSRDCAFCRLHERKSQGLVGRRPESRKVIKGRLVPYQHCYALTVCARIAGSFPGLYLFSVTRKKVIGPDEKQARE